MREFTVFVYFVCASRLLALYMFFFTPRFVALLRVLLSPFGGSGCVCLVGHTCVRCPRGLCAHVCRLCCGDRDYRRCDTCVWCASSGPRMRGMHKTHHVKSGSPCGPRGTNTSRIQASERPRFLFAGLSSSLVRLPSLLALSKNRKRAMPGACA